MSVWKVSYWRHQVLYRADQYLQRIMKNLNYVPHKLTVKSATFLYDPKFSEGGKRTFAQWQGCQYQQIKSLNSLRGDNYWQFCFQTDNQEEALAALVTRRSNKHQEEPYGVNLTSWSEGEKPLCKKGVETVRYKWSKKKLKQHFGPINTLHCKYNLV